jgi:hypothetical protein
MKSELKVKVNLYDTSHIIKYISSVVSISKTKNHIFPCVIGDNIEFFDPNGFKDDKSSYTKQIKKVISKVSDLGMKY